MWISGRLRAVFTSRWSPSEGTYFVIVFPEVGKVSHGFSEPPAFLAFPHLPHPLDSRGSQMLSGKKYWLISCIG